MISVLYLTIGDGLEMMILRSFTNIVIQVRIDLKLVSLHGLRAQALPHLMNVCMDGILMGSNVKKMIKYLKVTTFILILKYFSIMELSKVFIHLGFTFICQLKQYHKV